MPADGFEPPPLMKRERLTRPVAESGVQRGVWPKTGLVSNGIGGGRGSEPSLPPRGILGPASRSFLASYILFRAPMSAPARSLHLETPVPPHPRSCRSRPNAALL